MAKQNKNIWRKWTPCKKCNGRNTFGGIKVLFGLFRLKKWEHPCGCDTTTISCSKEKIIIYHKNEQTELNKEKCKEVINENKEQNND